MTARVSRQLRASGHRFLLRRLESALLYGDPDSHAGSVAAPRFWYAFGTVPAALIAAGHLLLPLLWPA